MKLLRRSDKDKITFKAIEKHRYGLRETLSKHLKESPLWSQNRIMEVHHGCTCIPWLVRVALLKFAPNAHSKIPVF